MAAALAGPGAAAATAKARPARVPPCNALIAPKTVLGVIGGSVRPGMTILKPLFDAYSLWGDGPSGRRGGRIPNTQCWYDWNYTYGRTPPAADPLDSTVRPPNSYVVVGQHATISEWNNIRRKEVTEPGGDGDGCSGACSYQPVRTLKLGYGSKAFVVTWGQFGTPPQNVAYAHDYEIFVFTRHHNILEVSIWPASLGGLTALVSSVLRHHASL